MLPFFPYRGMLRPISMVLAYTAGALCCMRLKTSLGSERFCSPNLQYIAFL